MEREEVGAIGLGTWQTFPALDRVLPRFAELGGRLVDSSPMYGRAEAVLGEVARRHGLRDRLFFATKVWTRGRTAGIAQMEQSERLLGGRVDLMQVHNLVDADTHLETLADWKRAGRVRYIGVTHYTASAYSDLARYLGRDGIDFVQVNYSVAEREAEQRILPLAQERGLRVLVNRPFGEGTILRRLRGKPLPSFASALGCTTWAELLLKFVTSHPAVTCAIPATSSPDHLRENMRAANDPLPDAATRKKIIDAVS